MLSRFYSDQPLYVKALTSKQILYPMKTTLDYTFALPPSHEEYQALLKRQPTYIDRNVGLQPLDTHDKELFARALHHIAEFVDIRFNYHPDYKGMAVFNFVFNETHQGKKGLVTGYTNWHGDYMGLGSQEVVTDGKYKTMMHEIMHWAFQLVDQPYDRLLQNTPHLDSDPREEFATFSIMNYAHEIDQGYLIQPRTLMPADIATLQFVVNHYEPLSVDRIKRIHLEDNLYHLKDLFYKYHADNLVHRTISTLVDHGGNDTLSADGMKEPVTLNLRRGPFARSAYQWGYIVASYDTFIENAICGEETTVVLNELNNVVTAPSGAKTTLVVDYLQCGHDTIIADNIDKLVIENSFASDSAMQKIMNLWKLTPHSNLDANNTLSGAKITFDENNSIFFQSTQPEKFNTLKIIMGKGDNETSIRIDMQHPQSYEVVPATLRSNQPQVTDQPIQISYDFADDFRNGMQRGVSFACLSIFTTAVLTQRLGFTPARASSINQSIQIMCSLYHGDILSLVTYYAVDKFCHRLNLSDANTSLVSTVISTAANMSFSFTPWGIGKAACAFAGGVLGSQTVHFIENKSRIVNRFCRSPISITASAVSALVSASFTLFGAAKRAVTMQSIQADASSDVSQAFIHKMV
jgi:hypothetical protein